MNKKLAFCLLCTLCVGIFSVNSEVVTSVEDFADVLDIETDLIDNLEKYINENTIKLTYLKDKLLRLRTENVGAKSNIRKYITNPMSAFSLLRRMAVDWSKLEHYMTQDPGERYILEIEEFKKLRKMPNSGDVEEAANGIIKLQALYRMSSANMSIGILNGVSYNSKLSALDCNSIGFYAFRDNQFYYADLWFAEAIKRFQASKENQVLGLRLVKLLEIASVNKNKQGDLEGAIRYLDQIIENYDDAMGAEEAKENFQKQLNERIANNIPPGYLGPPTYDTGFELYLKGCRGDLPARMDKELICKYQTKNHDFLKLAPIKMEIANVDPLITVFYDVIDDDEIKLIKDLATPMLSRATVFNPKTNENEPLKERTSKFAWLNITVAQTLQTIHERVKDMTGQTLLTSEKIQVLNYGLGGSQFIHLDSFEEPDSAMAFESLGLVDGNRVTTTLFYLSDVEQGGGTIFPLVEKVMLPKKGSAVFWYNLHPNGKREERTRHAACPVLVGSKWVMTQWVRLLGETFSKPCPLKENEIFKNN